MVLKVVDGGLVLKEDGLKIYDVILKVKYVRFFIICFFLIKFFLCVFFEMVFFL